MTEIIQPKLPKQHRLRTWAKNHKEEIIASTLMTGIVVAYVGAVYAAVKYDNKTAVENAARYAEYAAELTEWENALINSGKVAWRLADGRWLVTETASSAIEVVIK